MSGVVYATTIRIAVVPAPAHIRFTPTRRAARTQHDARLLVDVINLDFNFLLQRRLPHEAQRLVAARLRGAGRARFPVGAFRRGLCCGGAAHAADAKDK